MKSFYQSLIVVVLLLFKNNEVGFAQEIPKIKLVVDGLTEIISTSDSTAIYEPIGRSGYDTLGKTFTCKEGNEYLRFTDGNASEKSFRTMTLIFWIRSLQKTSDEVSLVSLQYNDHSDCGKLTFSLQSSSTLTVRRCGSEILGSANLGTAQWTHVAIVIYERSIIFYIDTIEYPRIQFDVGPMSLYNLTFCTTDVGQPFVGSIESVRLFTKDLPTSDIVMEFKDWCTNDCSYSGDGVCDDYGLLLQNLYVCDYGTDCDDCGVRPYKRDCYDYTCTTRGRRLRTDVTDVRCPESGCTDRLCCEAISPDCVGQDYSICTDWGLTVADCWSTFTGNQDFVFIFCRDMCGFCAEKHTCPVASIEGAAPARNCSGKQVVEIDQSCDWEPLPGYSCTNLHTSQCTGYDEELSSVPECHQSWCELPKSPELGVTIGHCHKKISGEECVPQCGEGFILDPAYSQDPVEMICSDGPEPESYFGSYFGNGNGASYIRMCAVEVQRCYVTATSDVSGMIMSLRGMNVTNITEISIPCGVSRSKIIWAADIENEISSQPCAPSLDVLVRDMIEFGNIGWFPSQWLLSAMKNSDLELYSPQECPEEWFSNQDSLIGGSYLMLVEIPYSIKVDSIRVTGGAEGYNTSILADGFNTSVGYNIETRIENPAPSRHFLVQLPSCFECEITMSGLYIKGWPVPTIPTESTDGHLVDDSVKYDQESCFEGTSATMTFDTAIDIVGYEIALCDIYYYDFEGKPHNIPKNWTLQIDNNTIHTITLTTEDWLREAQYSKFMQLPVSVSGKTLTVMFEPDSGEDWVRIGEVFVYTELEQRTPQNRSSETYFLDLIWSDNHSSSTQWVTPSYIIKENVLFIRTFNETGFHQRWIANNVASVVECFFLGGNTPQALVVLKNESIMLFSHFNTAPVLIPAIGVLATCADFDADGMLDIIVSSNLRISTLYGKTRDHVPLYQYRDMSQMYFVTREGDFDYETETSVSSMITFDYDSDGWIDLFITSFNGDDILYRGSRGGFEFEGKFGSKSISSTACDLNNDGTIDIITVSPGVTAVLFFNYHSHWSKYSIQYHHDGHSVMCSDLTSDGYNDLYISGVGATDFLLMNQMYHFAPPYEEDDHIFVQARNGPTDLSISATLLSDAGLYVAKKGGADLLYRINKINHNSENRTSIQIAVDVQFRGQRYGNGVTLTLVKDEVVVKRAVVAVTGRGTQSEYVTPLSIPIFKNESFNDHRWRVSVHYGEEIKTVDVIPNNKIITIELAASCDTFPLQYCTFLALKDNSDGNLTCSGSVCKELDKTTCCKSNPRCDLLWDTVNGCNNDIDNSNNKTEWCSSVSGHNCKRSCCEQGIFHDVCSDISYVNCDIDNCKTDPERYSLLCPVTCGICVPEPLIPRDYIDLPFSVIGSQGYISGSSEVQFDRGFFASSDRTLNIIISTFNNAPVSAIAFHSQHHQLDPTSVDIYCNTLGGVFQLDNDVGSFSITDLFIFSIPRRCSSLNITLSKSTDGVAVRQLRLYMGDPKMHCVDTLNWTTGNQSCKEYAELYCNDSVHVRPIDEQLVNFPSDNCCACGRFVQKNTRVCARTVGRWRGEDDDILFTVDFVDATDCCKACREQSDCRYWYHSSNSNEHTCIGYRDSRTVTFMSPSQSAEVTHIAGDVFPVSPVPRTCTDLLLSDDKLKDGLHKVYPTGKMNDPLGSEDINGRVAYCDMTNGGWHLFFNYAHYYEDVVLSPFEGDDVTTLPFVNHHSSVSQLGYTRDSISAVRFFCNTTQHNRTMDFYTKSDAVINLSTQNWFFGTNAATSAGDWRMTTKLQHHTAHLPEGAIGGQDMTKPIKSNNNMVLMGAYDYSGWVCDGPLDEGVSFPTLHQLWFKGITDFSEKHKKPSWIQTVISQHCGNLNTDIELHAEGLQSSVVMSLIPNSDSDWLCFVIRSETTSVEILYKNDCNSSQQSKISIYNNANTNVTQNYTCDDAPLDIQTDFWLVVKRGSESDGDLIVRSKTGNDLNRIDSCVVQQPNQQLIINTSPSVEIPSECFTLTCQQGHHVLLDWAPAALYWEAQVSNVTIWVERHGQWYREGFYGRGKTGFSVLDFKPELFKISKLQIEVSGGLPYFNLLGSGGWNCTDVTVRPCKESDSHTCDKGPGGLCVIRNEDPVCGCKKWYKDVGYACHSTCALHPGCGNGFRPKPHSSSIECGGWSCADVQCCEPVPETTSPTSSTPIPNIVTSVPSNFETSSPTAVPNTQEPVVVINTNIPNSLIPSESVSPSSSPVPDTITPVNKTLTPDINNIETQIPIVSESPVVINQTESPVAGNNETGVPIVRIQTESPGETKVPVETQVPTQVPEPYVSQSPDSKVPTSVPVVTELPTTVPTTEILVTNTPTDRVTEVPVTLPVQTIPPTGSPTQTPTRSPTQTPTQSPTNSPTNSPTRSPTQTPTRSPTRPPTQSPIATEMFLIFVMTGGEYEVVLIATIRNFFEGLELANPQNLVIEIVRKCVYNKELGDQPFYNEQTDDSLPCDRVKIASNLSRVSANILQSQPEGRVLIELRITSPDNNDFRVMRGVIKEQSFETSINRQLALKGVNVCALGNCVALPTTEDDNQEGTKFLVIIVIASAAVVLIIIFIVIRCKFRGTGPLSRRESERRLRHLDSTYTSESHTVDPCDVSHEMMMVPPAQPPTQSTDICISQIALSIANDSVQDIPVELQVDEQE